MNKLTANDIASEAGVSLATVDRVLNDRPWARENTALRVPMVRDITVRLKAQGIPVVTLVTDQPMSEREHFVGVDSVSAGRTAGRLIGRFTARLGKIAVLTNSAQARDTVDRRHGFDDILARDYPYLRPLASLEGWGDRDRSARELGSYLGRNPDTVDSRRGGTPQCRRRRLRRDRGSRISEARREGHGHLPRSDAAYPPRARGRPCRRGHRQNTGHSVRSAARILRAKRDGAQAIESHEKIWVEIVLKENQP